MYKKCVYIDESGNLADKNKFLIIAVISPGRNSQLNKIIPKIRKNMLKKTSAALPEIKYSRTTDQVQLKVARQLSQQNIEIYAWVVNKENRKIKDSAFNYGSVLGTVLKQGVNKYNWRTIIIHKKYTKQSDIKMLENTLNNQLKNSFESNIIFQTTAKSPTIGIADFVAGIFFEKFNRNNDKLYEVIEDKVVVCKKVSWINIKKEAVAPRGPVAMSN